MASRGSGMEDVLRNSDGDPNLLGTNRKDYTLNAYYDRPSDNWNSDNGFAFALPQLSLFLSYFLGEFCFISCPCQPPSILPTSSIFRERAMYFLSLRDFVSHNSIRNIFSVSIFLTAKRTYGSFSAWLRKLAVTTASMASIKYVSIFSPKEYRCVFGKIE